MKFSIQLRVKERIFFKLLLLVFKVVNDRAPEYVKECLMRHSHSRRTRLSSSVTFIVPRTYKLAGDAAFSSTAPRLWNKLPPLLKSSPSLDQFKPNLKTYLF